MIIPNTKLSENDIQTLLNNHKLFIGGEGIVCEGRKNSLYKIFSKSGEISPMSDNKEKKINKLYQLQLENSIKPISTLSCNGHIIGYEMETAPKLKVYKPYQLSTFELLYILRKTKNILEYFKSNDVIFGDFDMRNILFNKYTGDIQLCDMDNVKIGEYEMDLTPYGLLSYDLQRGIDYGAHPFTHNRLLLSFLGEDIYYISNYTILKLFNLKAINIISSMKNPENFNDEYLLDYMKKTK